jgi:CHAT domain-containing protein
MQDNYSDYRWNLLYILEYLAESYNKTGDLYRAQLYSQIGLSENMLGDGDPVTELLFTNISAVVYLHTQNFDLALEQFRLCKQITKRLPQERQFNLAYILQNNSKIYLELNQPDSSIYYLEESIKFQEAHPIFFENDFFSLYATAANRYLTVGDTMRALNYYEKAKQHFVEKAPLTEIAYFYEIGAVLDGIQNDIPGAYIKIEKAKELLSLRSNKARTLYPSEYFSMLTTLLNLKEQEYQKTKNLKLAQSYCDEAMDALDQALGILRTISSDAVQSVIINNTRGIFRHAINSIYVLEEQFDVDHHRDKLLFIFDSYQSILINKELDQKSWLIKNEINPEFDIKRKLFEHRYDSLLHASYQIPYDTDLSSDYQATSQAIYQTEDSLRLLKGLLRSTYPDYDDLMAQQDTLSNADLSALFSNSKSLMTCFRYEDELFVHYLNQSQNKLTRVEVDDEFERKLARWTKNISASNSGQTNSDSFIALTAQLHEDGYYLYQKLIAPFENRLSSDILIIPDSDIAQIAFSALNRAIPEEPTNYKAAHYLIEDHKFSTHYSLKLAARMIRQNNPNSRAAYSFVPNRDALQIPDPLSDDTMYLSSLPYSMAEGQLMQSLFDARLRTQGLATDSLISEIKSASLFHIGSHVVLNHSFPDQSYIPFINDQNELATIKPYELFNQPLGIDLVIVNACHSGKGKSTMGRGLLSFVGGFAMADVKSILSSRWAVHDKMGFTLLSNIAQKLKSGRSISESLRNGQLESLHRNDPISSHPSYWASYYLIGDTEVRINGDGRTIKWLIGLGLFGLLAFLGVRLSLHKTVQ